MAKIKKSTAKRARQAGKALGGQSGRAARTIMNRKAAIDAAVNGGAKKKTQTRKRSSR